MASISIFQPITIISWIYDNTPIASIFDSEHIQAIYSINTNESGYLSYSPDSLFNTLNTLKPHNSYLMVLKPNIPLVNLPLYFDIPTDFQAIEYDNKKDVTGEISIINYVGPTLNINLLPAEYKNIFNTIYGLNTTSTGYTSYSAQSPFNSLTKLTNNTGLIIQKKPQYIGLPSSILDSVNNIPSWVNNTTTLQTQPNSSPNQSPHFASNSQASVVSEIPLTLAYNTINNNATQTITSEIYHSQEKIASITILNFYKDEPFNIQYDNNVYYNTFKNGRIDIDYLNDILTFESEVEQAKPDPSTIISSGSNSSISINNNDISFNNITKPGPVNIYQTAQNTDTFSYHISTEAEFSGPVTFTIKDESIDPSKNPKVIHLRYDPETESVFHENATVSVSDGQITGVVDSLSEFVIYTDGNTLSLNNNQNYLEYCLTTTGGNCIHNCDGVLNITTGAPCPPGQTIGGIINIGGLSFSCGCWEQSSITVDMIVTAVTVIGAARTAVCSLSRQVFSLKGAIALLKQGWDEIGNIITDLNSTIQRNLQYFKKLDDEILTNIKYKDELERIINDLDPNWKTSGLNLNPEATPFIQRVDDIDDVIQLKLTEQQSITTAIDSDKAALAQKILESKTTRSQIVQKEGELSSLLSQLSVNASNLAADILAFIGLFNNINYPKTCPEGQTLTENCECIENINIMVDAETIGNPPHSLKLIYADIMPFSGTSVQEKQPVFDKADTNECCSLANFTLEIVETHENFKEVDNSRTEQIVEITTNQCPND